MSGGGGAGGLAGEVFLVVGAFFSAGLAAALTGGFLPSLGVMTVLPLSLGGAGGVAGCLMGMVLWGKMVFCLRLTPVAQNGILRHLEVRTYFHYSMGGF
jgi:hypothetical protein